MMRAIYNTEGSGQHLSLIQRRTFEWEPKFNKHLVTRDTLDGVTHSPSAGHIKAVTFQRQTCVQRGIRRLIVLMVFSLRVTTLTLAPSLLSLLIASLQAQVRVETAICDGEGGLGWGQTSPHWTLTWRLCPCPRSLSVI